LGKLARDVEADACFMRRCEGIYEGEEKIFVDRVDVSPSKPRVLRSSVEVELLVPGIQ
jgi:hypothetical protein